jgi:adenine-specific DNA-methyltransferase
MIYLDPPYGIKFGSNWQVSTRKRDVKDGKLEDATREVEQIKAFRDTWELGIHSYLSYLRDRLMAARDLLTESGSIFVQIGDENVHLVRSLLDEVFGPENFVSQISYIKTWGAGSFSGGTTSLAGVTDYVVWYRRNVEQLKYRQLYQLRGSESESADRYGRLELPDGRAIPITSATPKELQEGRQFRFTLLTSQTTRSGQTTVFPIEVAGKRVMPPSGGWKTNASGMRALQLAGRVGLEGRSAAYIRYSDDFPAYPLTNNWPDIGGVQSRADPKIYEAYSRAPCRLLAAWRVGRRAEFRENWSC